MKIQSSEQGIVLVITLIMLSVVTVMAVLFLGVSRRERASVTVTTDHITAKTMTESGFAHAQANIVSRMLTTSNRFNYDFAVSTNFLNINQHGLDVFATNFDDFENFNPENVGYHYGDGDYLDERDQAINIGNLQFDPRPPVYIQTNSNSRYRLDFRFFLNFNRNIMEFRKNGEVHRIPRFDSSGLLHEQGNNRAPLKVPNNNQAQLKTHMVGDPQWIGVLEYPNQPHSPTNRFVGRFAYLILPEGKSLDLNTVHNDTKNSSKTDFLRNQGVGPWEINLAAFLSELNFNQWSNYIYILPTDEKVSRIQHNNYPFNDAYSLLRYRMNYPNDLPNLRSTLDNLGISTTIPGFHSDNIDFFADGPYLEEQSWLVTDGDNLSETSYWGGDLRRAYYDVQELFDPAKVSTNFVRRLNQTGIRQLGNYSTYDSYTFYRLLSQLGVDSEADEQAETMMPASSDGKVQENKVRKLDLNYKFKYENGQTKIKEWEPRELFLNLADRLLQASVDSNPPDSQYTNHLGQLERIYGKDHYTIGGTYQRNQDFTNSANFSITNFGIQIWPRVHPNQPQYSAAIHQRLQQAANIADIVTHQNQFRPPSSFATTESNKFPLVFRPQFASGPRVYITNFVEVTNDALNQICLQPWRDLNVPANRYNLNPDDNVWGIPWVIAAKKGLPNFNEFGVLTAVELTRKLEINKGSPNASRSFWRTNQMLSLSVSNLFGVELWNSYTQAYSENLHVRADVQSDFLMTNQFGTLLVSNRYNNLFNSLCGTQPILNLSPNQWSGEEFQLPIFANRTMLQVTNRGGISPVPSAIYDHRRLGRLIPISRQHSNATNVLFPDNGFPVHRIGLAMTNRVRCLMTDPVTKRVVDFVNLDFVSGLDVQDLLDKEPSGYWIANRLGDTNAPTEGAMKQILVSLGEEEESDWNSYVGRGAGRDREEAIDLFRAFLGFRPLYLLSFNQRADAYNRLRDPRKSFRRQVPLSPSVRLVKYETLQANDPLVHYTFEDLKDNQQLVSMVRVLKPGQMADDLHNLGSPSEPGRKNQRYRPWPSTLAEAANQYNIAHKDPLIRRSDDWQFPTNKFPNIGWLGRVHRGTPWQTIYLKGYVGSYEGGQGGDNKLKLLTVQDLPDPNPTLLMPYDGRSYPFQTLAVYPSTGEVVDTLMLDRAVAGNKQNILNLARTNWFKWAGSSGTHPTNDWKILEFFTTSLNDNASKGLLSVNQAGLAAWSAVFSGVTVQTNMPPNSVRIRDIQTPKGPKPAEYEALTIQPAGRAGMPGYDLANPGSGDNWQLAQIVNGTNGINATRSRFPGGRFRHLGEVLATPALTVQSPFLDWTDSTVYQLGLDDFAVERIPQQVLSLLKADEPRVTIYSYGQSLRPAEGSLRTDPNPIRLLNLCTNYQITGEFAAKRVVRFDGSLTNLNAVVESEIVIPVD